MTTANTKPADGAASLGLGKIITTEQRRDAIHIAVCPVTAAERLKPGTRVGLYENGEAGAYSPAHVGIVDPYLTEDVQVGQRFWMFLFPGSVTSLRHVWTHPRFAEEV